MEALNSSASKNAQQIDGIAFSTLMDLKPSDISTDVLATVNIFKNLPTRLAESKEIMADMRSVGIDTPEMIHRFVALEDWWLYLDKAFDFTQMRPALTDPELRPGYIETVETGKQHIANTLIVCCRATAYFLSYVQETWQ